VALRAGAVQITITPPIGVELAGYGPQLHRNAQDILDDLMAQALVLDDGATRLALVTCDLILLSEAMVGDIRAQVAERTNIPADHVMVSCIHSHTAPTAHPIFDWGMPDEEYIRYAARLMAGAVVAAVNRLQPASLKLAQGQNTELQWNRTTGGTLTDPTVDALEVDAEDGKPLALLVHYACHPVMLGPKAAFSADYPGALRRTLSKDYPGAVVLFANGACGDIDPWTNKRAWGSASYAEVEQTGASLAASVVDALKSAQPLANPKLGAKTGTLVMPYEIPSVDEIRQRIANYKAQADALAGQPEDFKDVVGEVQMPNFWLRFYQGLLDRLLNNQQPKQATAEIQMLRLSDDVALVGIPAEVYTEQGLAIRAASPYRHTLVVGYANGTFGYTPPPDEFERKVYIAVFAFAVGGVPPYIADVAARVVDAVAELLK
jgi:hypothetical protein